MYFWVNAMQTRDWHFYYNKETAIKKTKQNKNNQKHTQKKQKHKKHK